jgi:hypothetical protein
MRFNVSFLSSPQATCFQNSSNWRYADPIGVARTAIEREYFALAQDDPRLLRLALNEAEALAWATGFPELIFPVLAQEKAGKVAVWHERQKSVREPRPVHAFAA